MGNVFNGCMCARCPTNNTETTRRREGYVLSVFSVNRLYSSSRTPGWQTVSSTHGKFSHEVRVHRVSSTRFPSSLFVCRCHSNVASIKPPWCTFNWLYSTLSLVRVTVRKIFTRVCAKQIVVNHVQQTSCKRIVFSFSPPLSLELWIAFTYNQNYERVKWKNQLYVSLPCVCIMKAPQKEKTVLENVHQKCCALKCLF